MCLQNYILYDIKTKLLIQYRHIQKMAHQVLEWMPPGKSKTKSQMAEKESMMQWQEEEQKNSGLIEKNDDCKTQEVSDIKNHTYM